MDKKELQNRLGEFLEVLRHEEKAKRTIAKYKRDIQKFIDFLPDDLNITKDHTISYKSWLIDSKKFEVSSINGYIISLNKYLRYLEQSQLRVKQLKVQSKSSLAEMMSPADAHRMLRWAKKLGMDDMYYLMKILMYTGCRISELDFFTVENLDFYIQAANKGKIRNLILRQDLLRELRKYSRENRIKCGTLFPGKVKGKQMAQSTIWRRMKKIAGKARIKKELIHAHSFRHLFAILFLEQNNNNILELADILGHDSLDTTRIYGRSTDERKRKKIEQLKY